MSEHNYRGIMHPPLEQLTEDGYDLQFGTNVLGHYYLTMLVMPALLAGTKTSGDGHARVVNTSSSGHMFYGINFNSFRDGSARRKMRSSRLYFQSKTVRQKFILAQKAYSMPMRWFAYLRVILFLPSSFSVDMLPKE